MIQAVWENSVILRWVDQTTGKVWGLTPVNVVFSITTHFHFLLTFQVDVVYNFRFDLFLFLDGRIRQIRRRYREKVSVVLAAFVNPVHSLIRRGKNKQVNTFSLNISPLTADKGLGRTWLIDMSEWHVKCWYQVSCVGPPFFKMRLKFLF